MRAFVCTVSGVRSRRPFQITCDACSAASAAASFRCGGSQGLCVGFVVVDLACQGLPEHLGGTRHLSRLIGHALAAAIVRFWLFVHSRRFSMRLSRVSPFTWSTIAACGRSATKHQPMHVVRYAIDGGAIPAIFPIARHGYGLCPPMRRSSPLSVLHTNMVPTCVRHAYSRYL